MTYGKTVKISAVGENQTRMSRNMSNRGRPESGRSSSVAGTNREWWSETVLLVLQVESKGGRRIGLGESREWVIRGFKKQWRLAENVGFKCCSVSGGDPGRSNEGSALRRRAGTLGNYCDSPRPWQKLNCVRTKGGHEASWCWDYFCKLYHLWWSLPPSFIVVEYVGEFTEGVVNICMLEFKIDTSWVTVSQI